MKAYVRITASQTARQSCHKAEYTRLGSMKEVMRIQSRLFIYKPIADPSHCIDE